jgi:hypothetical protein
VLRLWYEIATSLRSSQRRLDCGNPRCGVCCIRCPDCGEERLAELFAREVLADLVRKELLSPEWGERIHAFRHTGFNVHSLVRAKTSVEAERVGKYMIRPVLSLERLSLDEREGKVC